MIDLLTLLLHHPRVAATTAAGFDSPKRQRRTLRRQADFLRPLPSCASMGGRLQGGFGLPVSFVTGLSTLLSARPPHLTVGSGFNPTKEAAMRANAPARPEQTQYPLIEQAAITAAELWLQHAPESLADWCDTRFKCLAAGMNWYSDYHDRKAAFEQAYALRIGQAMVGVRHG